MSPNTIRQELPDSRGVIVEGQPPRFGFEQQWIGMFHWTALVFDPERTIEAQGPRGSSLFGYSMLGYHHR